MLFFVGIHQPCDAGKVPAAMVSVHRIKERKSGFPVRRWILDSGAFRTIEIHGGYPEPAETYAGIIKKFAKNGRLLAAVSQDYMCEPAMLKRTGLTISDHQRLTIERYDKLRACDTGGVYLMPVLQGYAPEDYAIHIRQYGERLKLRAWVGVGSVCKRNGNPDGIRQVLHAIQSERPDLRLHGFGIKIQALRIKFIRESFFSSDSMAWSFAARRSGGDRNNVLGALDYIQRVHSVINGDDELTVRDWQPEGD